MKCPCAIELAGSVRIGATQTCGDCGQVWVCEPAEGAACRWRRAHPDDKLPKLKLIKGGKA